MYGADPRLADLGSKTGCRRMFEELGVPCPVGAEDLHTVDDIVAGVQSMRVRRPSLNQAIVKLNEGVSGAGNAMVDLHGLPAPGSPNEAAAIKERLLAMQPEAESLAVDVYLAAFEKHGGIVEERITGVALTSPSVQMRALPDGTVELLSTHDQLLGGASGQKYLGCVFPANADYAAAIAEPAMVIGRHLAELGVLGRFAVDFVVVQDESGAWTPYAIELNLRKGGTTHPFLTLQFLTDGTYDGERGVFLTPSGSAKYLVATDHFEDERLKALTVDGALRRRRETRSAFRPGPPYRSGVPHDQLPHRVRSRRTDRGRRHPRGCVADLRGGAGRAPPGGGGGTRGRSRRRLNLRLATDDPVWYVAYGSNMSRRVSAATSPVDDRGAPAVPTWDVVTSRHPAETSASTWPVASPLRANPRCGAAAWPSTTLTSMASWRRGHTCSPSDSSATWSPRKPGGPLGAIWRWTAESIGNGQCPPSSTRLS